MRQKNQAPRDFPSNLLSLSGGQNPRLGCQTWQSSSHAWWIAKPWVPRPGAPRPGASPPKKKGSTPCRGGRDLPCVAGEEGTNAHRPGLERRRGLDHRRGGTTAGETPHAAAPGPARCVAGEEGDSPLMKPPPSLGKKGIQHDAASTFSCSPPRPPLPPL